jgi:hypothetical protein
MHVVSFKGVALSAGDYWTGINPEDAKGLWSIVPSIVPRRNDQGQITSVTVSERPIAAQIGYKGTGLSFEQAFFTLIGQLNPLDAEPGELVIQLNEPDEDDDPIVLSCSAIITLPGGATADGDVNVVAVTFLTTDPLWHSITPVIETSGTIDNATYGGLTIDVEGAAPVSARVRLTPNALDNQVDERHFSITNNGTQPWVQQAIKVDCGNQSGFAPAILTYKTLLLDGKPQRAEFIGWGTSQAYLIVVVPYLAPGDTITYQTLVSEDYSLESPGFNSYTQPAFDYGWEVNIATGGSTTTFVLSSGTWELHRWRGGNLTMLTGVNAGVTRAITDNTATTITTAAFPSANAAGASGMVHMSSNGKSVYQVRQTERSNNQRGLWWINQGQKKPSDYRFDVPGGWVPWLYYDNADQKVQRAYTAVNVGTVDYFAILDAWRTWKSGQAIKSRWLGNADGVSLSLPFEITSVKLSEQLRNPNSMCKFIVGSRALGADEFIEEYVNSTAHDTLTSVAAHTVTMTAGTTQVYLGLIPGLDVDGNQKEEIGDEWAKDSGTATIGDTGTATSATSTTLVDSSKAWTTSQWVGFRVIITNGTGGYQERVITANTATTLTVATWGTTPDTTSNYIIARRNQIDDSTKNWITDQWVGATATIVAGRGKGRSTTVTGNGSNYLLAPFGVNIDSTSQYTVVNKKTQAIARTDDTLEVNWDASTISITPISEARRAYVLDRELFVDRDTAAADPPYQRLRFSYPYTGRHLVLHQAESLVIDGESMDAWIDATRPEFVATNSVTALVNGANTKYVPIGTDIGDTILAVVQNGNGAVLTPPPGFTAIKLETVGSVTYRVYQGKMVTDLANPLTWTYGSAPSSATIFQIAYRNLRTAAPNTSNANHTTAQTTHSAGSVTVSDDYSMVVHILITSGAVSVTASPAGTTAHAIDTSHFVYDKVELAPVATQSYSFTTNIATNGVIFSLVFGPDAEMIPIPPRSLIVQDVEDDGTERLAEQWLSLTPGEHTLMLSAVTDGNDYLMELEYSPSWFG